MDESPSLKELSPNAIALARAMALQWTWSTRKTNYDLVRQFDAKTADGSLHTLEKIKLAHEELDRAGVLIEHDYRQGYWRLSGELRAQLYLRLLKD